MILRYLKEDAESYLGEEVTEAVISVPAYFDDKRRKATKRAGELAGLKVERMISEPTAAAAYGLYEKEKDTRFLVFDLGSDRSEVSMELILTEETKTATITLKEYEEACEELLLKIREPVKKSLSDAGLKLQDIDEVLLIGGATRLSVVRDFLIRLFRKFPDTTMNPDEAVALGAAIQATMKERRAEVKKVILTDVCSFTLGTEVVVEYEEGKFEDGRFCPIIERNTGIPASHTERLYTVRDNQDKVRVRVLQGESRFARNNLFLGELNIDVPKGPKGSEAVDVTYTYDINSLLEVEVKVVSTGLTQKMIIKGQDNQMTDEEIQKRMEELSYLKIQPRDLEENRNLISPRFRRH